MKTVVSKFKTIFSKENLLPKIASLAIAMILWAVISGSRSSEIKLRIPIVMKNLPADMSVSEISDKTALIVMEGRKDNFKDISAKNLSAVVNLENPKVGKLAVYPVDIIKNEIPINVRVELLNKEIKIRVERLISKNVKVAPAITGKIREGKVIGNVRVVPEYIIIRGSKSAVEKITEVKTETIDVDNRGEDLMKDAEIEKDSRNDIKYSESNIKVFISIFDAGSLFELTMPVVIRGGRKNFEYYLDTRSVKVKIKSPRRKISESDITASADFSPVSMSSDIKKESSINMELPIIVKIKGSLDGVEILSITPEKAKFKITSK